jgi:hypothetical protein
MSAFGPTPPTCAVRAGLNGTLLSESAPGPRPPTCALQQVGSYLGYTAIKSMQSSRALWGQYKVDCPSRQNLCAEGPGRVPHERVAAVERGGGLRSPRHAVSAGRASTK